ncbi:MAG: DUF1343 domain-containing protein [Gemmatimonadaceae bacterium]|nr:DUF1343 domain-containing protein [Gemmatimonadaceae bacterium]
MTTIADHIAPIRFGVDQLVADPSRVGWARRVGLVTNNAARLAADHTQFGRHALQRAGVPLVRLFGPEHGLSGHAADGAAVTDGHDAVTDLPVVSLYGTTMRPSPANVADLDLMLFDIPDVGARFYTYTWTLYHVLLACADANVPLVVLDRPNPLGGVLADAEGPILDLAFRSFIGEDRIPIRHSLTLGELARLWDAERLGSRTASVVTVDGWQRHLRWPQLQLPWIETSPSMPSYDSVRWYPATCLFEATNLSVGRGTDRPFQMVGAPWLDAPRTCESLAQHGIASSPTLFRPKLPPYAGEVCRAVELHDAPAVSGIVATGLQLLAVVSRLHRSQFAWHAYKTSANPGGENHFERLLGIGDARAAYDAQTDEVTRTRIRSWTDASAWVSRVRSGPPLLYPEESRQPA